MAMEISPTSTIPLVGKTIGVGCRCRCSRTPLVERDDKSISKLKDDCFPIDEGDLEYKHLDRYKEYSANEYFAEVNYCAKNWTNYTMRLPLKHSSYHTNAATPLAMEAIRLFNQHKKKNFQFVRLLNLNGQEQNGMVYYITFEAMDVDEAEGQPIPFKAMVFTWAGFGWKPQIYSCVTDHEQVRKTLTTNRWMGPLVDDDKSVSEVKDERVDGPPFSQDEEDDDVLMAFDKFKEYSASEFFSYVNYCCMKFKSFTMVTPLKRNSYHRNSATALAIEAINKFNQQNNKKFEFVMLLNLNGQKKMSGMTYYISFEARDAAESEGQPITFQAMVIIPYEVNSREPEFRFCRIKPNEKQGTEHEQVGKSLTSC